MRPFLGLEPGQRAQGQAQARGRVAGDQEQPAAAGGPALALPADPTVTGLPGLERQDEGGRHVEAAVEDPGEPLALQRIVQPVVERVEVLGELVLAQQEMGRVLEGRQDRLGIDPEPLGEAPGEPLGRGDVGAGSRPFAGDQLRPAPQGHPVGPPIEREGPARQLLARVPFALAVVEEPARGEARHQPPDEIVGAGPLGGAGRRGVPLRRVARVDADEGRLAAHGEADVAAVERGIDPLAGRQDRLPVLLGVGLGDPRLLPDPPHRHREGEPDLARVDQAADRRRGLGVGGAGERQVTFAREQARGRIEADPAGAGQIDLGPGVQVGEVGLGPGGAVERLHVGGEHNQVARDEAGGEPQMAEDLDQEPARVAAGAGAEAERLLGRLHARLHPDEVADLARDLPVELDQEGHRAGPRPRDRGDPLAQARSRPDRLEVGLEVLLQLGLVDERPVLGVRLDEEVEGVERGHLGHEVDLDLEMVGLVGEDEARLPVGVRVLLPVDEMAGRADGERVSEDAGAAVRGRAQPDELRREGHEPVVAVARPVVEGDVHDHGAVRSVHARKPGRAR